MKITDILSVLPFYDVTNLMEGMEINTIEMDSRKVKSGDLFVCIKGYTVDGHDYVQQAVNNGAVAILAEKRLEVDVPVIIVGDTSRAAAMLATKFYNYPTRKFPLIGVTGTNGKTTVTYLLETIFKQFKKKTGVIGTIQMKIGDDSYPVKNTTPDALFLQKVFDQMVKDNVETGIMEVSSHALDQGRVFGCEFDIAIFTNLSQDHLDYHKDMDDYLRAKSLLFAQLGNTYNDKQKKFAVINQDDPVSKILKRSTAQHVLTYGCKNEAQIMATDIQLDVTATNFILKTPIGEIAIKSKLIGMFNVYNMLAASAAAIAANIPLTTIKTALENITGVSGRFEPVLAGQSFATLVDYAHTPDSLENVLQTINGFAKQKVYVVVGCGGDRDKTKRPLMAEIALKYADRAIFTSDNPRTEDAQSILDDMTEGLEQDHFDVITNRKEAIFKTIELAKADDIVLIAGKGHETYQQIGDVKYDFDDRQVAREAIQAKENK
ncbi:UDP-N-acetylmuramoyl-L-alanyl-D-glutamate--2,6-diaminopimelate ligase [Lentibacillus sp. Marseille-P4043]|uniref:UDP-N-acetylmuramoyl-L-alanyl-D-glutamate--2, 6-diaminopimelate ligase n=1 Tax=Lentibacillus sp. Marseille-P4043 TaxID=2040293 RepID=UPI000D0BD3B1|nr:UDP-N-acetylmuramoyl-L-alanyl-D-glutamate--2,6-diaminopimelate ligase [Lentibacillus sp. Marseille-P4043]